MKNLVVLLSIIALTIGLIGCQNQNESIKKGKGEVVNKDDFIITSFDSRNIKKDIEWGISGFDYSPGTLFNLEKLYLEKNKYSIGDAAIIKGMKIGKSESFYKDYGVIVNSAGDKERDVAAFTLTQIEVHETYDGDFIKANDVLVKKGDIITLCEPMWVVKDEKGKEILRKRYGYNVPALEDGIIYILYMSKFTDGVVFEHAIMNNVWNAGQGVFILNSDTKSIKNSDDVVQINKDNEKSKKYDCYLYPELYPLVIEKYGQ